MNNFLLAGDRFMPEMQKNKEIIKTKNKGRTLKLKKKHEIHNILIKTK